MCQYPGGKLQHTGFQDLLFDSLMIYSCILSEAKIFIPLVFVVILYDVFLLHSLHFLFIFPPGDGQFCSCPDQNAY